MSPEKQARGYECRRRIVNFILAYSAINRYPPTYEDIALAIGVPSMASIRRHLDRLQKEGYISRVAKAPRTIIVLKAMT